MNEILLNFMNRYSQIFIEFITFLFIKMNVVILLKL